MWGRSNRWGIALLLIFCCFGMGRSVAEETTAATSNGKQEKKTPGSSLVDSLSLTSRRDPIHISSRQLEFLYDEKRIVYRGDVVAVQGDVTMKSDQLTVLYEDVPPTADVTTVKAGKPENSEGAAPGASKQRLKEIIAEGHVDITSGNRRATGKKAVFNEGLRTVVLSGDAHVQELGNWVSGERVTVFLDEKRSIVEGSGERRAEMEIRSDQQQEKKKEAKKP